MTKTAHHDTSFRRYIQIATLPSDRQEVEPHRVCELGNHFLHTVKTHHVESIPNLDTPQGVTLAAAISLAKFIDIRHASLGDRTPIWYALMNAPVDAQISPVQALVMLHEARTVSPRLTAAQAKVFVGETIYALGVSLTAHYTIKGA